MGKIRPKKTGRRKDIDKEYGLDYIFLTGKYLGHCIGDVINTDINYISYLIDNTDFTLRADAFEKFVQVERSLMGTKDAPTRTL